MGAETGHRDQEPGVGRAGQLQAPSAGGWTCGSGAEGNSLLRHKPEASSLHVLVDRKENIKVRKARRSN